MKDAFRKVGDVTPPEHDEDLAFAVAHLREHEIPESEWPELLTISSWFALHESSHSSPDEIQFIYDADRVKDETFRMEDDDHPCAMVVGFNDDATGREAIHLMHGWVGARYPVWKRGGDGQYREIDVGQNPYAIDLNNPISLQNAVTEVVLNIGKRQGPARSELYDPEIPF